MIYSTGFKNLIGNAVRTALSAFIEMYGPANIEAREQGIEDIVAKVI
jgi:hypothetical protein